MQPRGWTIGVAAFALLALSACATYPEERFLPLTASDAGTPPQSLSIMTYNIEGLPWPARSGRGPFLEAISAELARMDTVGALPEVVVFQEAFSTSALEAAANNPHPVLAFGPRRRTDTSFARAIDPALQRRNILRGEWGIKVFGGGLAVASHYPISVVAIEPFGPRSCAGWDCLSNKGMMLVQVHLPGLTDPVEVLTTHMNSQGSSGVSVEKQTAAHRVQSEQLAQFIDQHSISDNPLVIAGDFNMRGSPQRFDAFERETGFNLARRYCLEAQSNQDRENCEIAVSFDGDAPWLDTQDLQIFDDGAHIALRPTRLEAWFDGEDAGGELSDHDAYIVTYALEARTGRIGHAEQGEPGD